MWEAKGDIKGEDRIIKVEVRRVDETFSDHEKKVLYNQYILNLVKCEFMVNIVFSGPRDLDVDPFHEYIKDWLRYCGATQEMLNYYDDNTYDGLWPVFFKTKKKLIDFYGRLDVEFAEGDDEIYATNITTHGRIVGGRPKAI